MLASQSMALRHKLTKIINQWPVMLIVVGGTLTLIWLALLIWFPMRLLQIV
jgi:hypothetical protein